MFDNIEHINWDDFHFLRTEYWWVSIVIAALLLLTFIIARQSRSWEKHIAPHLRPYVIFKGTKWKTRLIQFSVLLMFAIAVTSFLGPTWNQIELPSKKVKSQLVVALDLSQSMMTEDISPTRLERAKFKIYDFLKANPRAETQLMVFAGTAHVAIPFTTDYKIITDQLDGLKPSMMPVQGTGFQVLFNRLDTIFQDNIAVGKVLLITDDLEELSSLRVSEFVQNNNVNLYIYPFSLASGGEIPKHRVNSALNVEKLNGFSQIENVDILEMTLDNSDVEDLAAAISENIIFEDETDLKDENWLDNGYWLLFPLSFVFLFSFRRGWSINIIILCISLTSCSEENQKEALNQKWTDLWYTSDYQAQQEYDNAEYLKAAQKFSDPMRKGVSYYKGGDYLSAQTFFEQDSTVNGLYNLGLTYAKLGKLEEAQEVFNEVLEKDPSNENASSNLEGITALIDAQEATNPESISNNPKGEAENEQNSSPEDLSGGGQEATKEDMQKERLEETTTTDMRTGKELDELPDDFESGSGDIPKNILLRKVDDDPALFLTRKFRYQLRKKQVETEKTNTKW